MLQEFFMFSDKKMTICLYFLIFFVQQKYLLQENSATVLKRA